jgi:hypothetical protein
MRQRIGENRAAGAKDEVRIGGRAHRLRKDCT